MIFFFSPITGGLRKEAWHFQPGANLRRAAPRGAGKGAAQGAQEKEEETEEEQQKQQQC